MKKAGRVFICLLLALTIALGLQTSVFAADRQYTVRIYAGDEGAFTDTASTDPNVLELKVTHGDRVDFSVDMIKLNDGSKYYVRGIREAGKDNDLAAASFEVTRDMDFVVSYGMLSSVAKYTISYVDGKGKELATSKEFVGNVGDKPVVAYQFIEGYIPRYYNLTATLQEGANAWSFTYDKIVVVTPEPSPLPRPTPVVDGAVVTPDSAAAGDAAANGGTMPANTAPGGDKASQPEEIHDMDPAAPADAGTTPADAGTTPAETPASAPAETKSKAPVIIGVSGGVIAIGGLIAWALSRAKKKAGKSA